MDYEGGGVAEKKNIHLLEVTNKNLIHMQVQKILWSEVYICVFDK